jgi:hypothetical protein
VSYNGCLNRWFVRCRGIREGQRCKKTVGLVAASAERYFGRNRKMLGHFCGFVRFARPIHPTRKSSRSTALDSQFTSSEFICGTPWFDIATDVPRFVCGLAVVRWMERQRYAGLPRRGMQLATIRLEKRQSFQGCLQSKYSHHSAAPATACQNTDARCHALSR